MSLAFISQCKYNLWIILEINWIFPFVQRSLSGANAIILMEVSTSETIANWFFTRINNDNPPSKTVVSVCVWARAQSLIDRLTTYRMMIVNMKRTIKSAWMVSVVNVKEMKEMKQKQPVHYKLVHLMQCICPMAMMMAMTMAMPIPFPNTI